MALALAGGGPFGAIYEIGALLALQDSLEGLDLNDLDAYVGVSAGGFLAAALANGISIGEIHRLFIRGEDGSGALTPELFTRPAFREFAQRATRVPPLLAQSLWRMVSRPLMGGPMESFAGLGHAIPTGIFDSEAIHRYLADVFTRPGRSNDFRELGRKLYLVATNLDTGESVSFGRPGYDHIPISRAIQASSALPGLFPPVEIDEHHYVDGALKKTLHASEALDDGARLVICVNPIVPYDARLAAEKGRQRGRLVDGGLPAVLSQTFRAIIHSRMAVGLSKYRSRYPGAEVVLFQPDPDDSEIFFTNIFSYATRHRICEHAFRRTRHDLLRRRDELRPLFAREGLRLRLDRLREENRALPGQQPAPSRKVRRGSQLRQATTELREAVVELRRWLEREEGPSRAAP